MSYNLLRELYDYGDHWNYTVNNQLERSLGVTQDSWDPSLHWMFIDNNLTKLLGDYLSDSKNAENQEFQTFCDCTFKMFGSQPRIYDESSFYGTQISINENKVLSLR